MSDSYLVTVRLQVKKKGIVRMLNPKIMDERLEAKDLTKRVADEIVGTVRAAFGK